MTWLVIGSLVAVVQFDKSTVGQCAHTCFLYLCLSPAARTFIFLTRCVIHKPPSKTKMFTSHLWKWWMHILWSDDLTLILEQSPCVFLSGWTCFVSAGLSWQLIVDTDTAAVRRVTVVSTILCMQQLHELSVPSRSLGPFSYATSSTHTHTHYWKTRLLADILCTIEKQLLEHSYSHMLLARTPGFFFISTQAAEGGMCCNTFFNIHVFWKPVKSQGCVSVFW